MQLKADLHTHTNFSDGILSPQELLQKAAKVGLGAISITDHDTIEGVRKAKELADKFNIEVITGCEFSCYENGREYHILGYFFDTNHKSLNEHLDNYKKLRLFRAKQIYKKLQDAGMKFDFDLIQNISRHAPIARPHIGMALVEMGYVNTLKEAFEKYIGDAGPAYYPKANFPVERAIELINSAGGVASLAHPANFVDQPQLYKMIKSGLDGIEVNHPMHNEQQVKFYRSIASQYWLIETGGSDFHGNRDWDEGNFGKYTVPMSTVESLRFRANKH